MDEDLEISPQILSRATFEDSLRGLVPGLEFPANDPLLTAEIGAAVGRLAGLVALRSAAISSAGSMDALYAAYVQAAVEAALGPRA